MKPLTYKKTTLQILRREMESSANNHVSKFASLWEILFQCLCKINEIKSLNPQVVKAGYHVTENLKTNVIYCKLGLS